ncbi:MAG: glycosyltransferase family 2 [Bacteroidetes bacterium]|nr:glycosyltransferase family 2 [Bacteroidota bacterium]
MENNKESNFVSAVVYCYNDAEYINDFIGSLDKTLATNFLKYEIVVVNDCSTDDSMQTVKQYATHKEGLVISLLNMSYHQGIETSMNAGVNLTIGDFVFEFDSVYVDYDWKVLMDIYFHSLEGFDIVSARVNKGPRVISRMFYALFNRYAKLQYKVGMETFRVLSRRAINRIHSITQTIPFRKAAYANCGLAIDVIEYIPVRAVMRKHYDDRMGLAVDSLILFTNVAYCITFTLAIIMMLITIGVAIYALIYKLMENPVEGWTTTILFLAFGFFGLFTILAMVIKYLQMIVKLHFSKKEYLFESINKLQ